MDGLIQGPMLIEYGNKNSSIQYDHDAKTQHVIEIIAIIALGL